MIFADRVQEAWQVCDVLLQDYQLSQPSVSIAKNIKCSSDLLNTESNSTVLFIRKCFSFLYMSHFSYACKTKGENGISHLISILCVNCLSAILEYSRIIDYSIIWMCIWCGLLQKLHKIKKSELLNSKVSFKL